MKPIRIAHLSDFHLTELTINPLRLLSKRLIGTLNWLFTRRNTFSKKQVTNLAPLLRSLDLDLILLGGDFTTTSLDSEFRQAKTFTDSLTVPWLAIPGNHDAYTQKAYRQKVFYRYFTNDRPITHKTGFFKLSQHGVEAHRLGETTWWVVALDTARATWTNSARGLFSEATEKNLREILTLIPADHQIIALNHYPFFQNDLERRNLERGEFLKEIIVQDPRIKTYLHGHTHRHTIANLQPSGFPVVLDSGCCADRKKGSWNLLIIDDQGIQIDVYIPKNNDWTHSRTEKFAWTR